MVAHAFDPWEAETGGSEIQGHSQPCSKFKTNQGYTKCCLKKIRFEQAFGPLSIFSEETGIYFWFP